MAASAQFDEFVRERSSRLQRVAYLLTRDHNLAEDLLQTALAQSWSAWSRIEGDPEPYVRRVLVNAYNSWWRRKWTSELPSDNLPESGGHSPQSGVDDRDEIWRALGRLSRQQRTVLVLRYIEDLSEAQIAQTLSISAGAVKSHASKGLAKLRLDPTLGNLPELATAPLETGRVAGVRQRITTHRRNRLVSAVAACVLLFAVVGGYVFGSLPADDPIAQVMSANGYDVVARVENSYSDHETATITWTPSSLAFAVAATCVGKKFEALMTIRINGRELPETVRCKPDGKMIDISADAARYGVQVGKPATITVSIEGAETDGRFAIAVGEAS